jgi:hypothetical protein
MQSYARPASGGASLMHTAPLTSYHLGPRHIVTIHQGHQDDCFAFSRDSILKISEAHSAWALYE